MCPRSKWPKTTLGALDDDAPPLSLKQLEALRGLCLEHSTRLAGLTVSIERLSLVTYTAWRGLERPVKRIDVALPGPASSEVCRCAALHLCCIDAAFMLDACRIHVACLLQ